MRRLTIAATAGLVLLTGWAAHRAEPSLLVAATMIAAALASALAVTLATQAGGHGALRVPALFRVETSRVLGHRRIAVPPVAAVGVLTALIVGVALARDPRLGVVLVAAVLYVALVLIDPPLGIALWVALSFLSSLGKVGLALTAATALIAIAALATVRRDGVPALAGRGLLLPSFALMLTWFVVSLAWSEDPGAGGEMLFEWGLTGAMLVAVAVTVRTPRDVRLIIGGLVAGPVLSVLVGFANDGLGGAAPDVDTATSVGGRLVGGVGDPNFLGIAIVPAIVLAAILRGARPLTRWALAVAIGVLVVGLLATQSRGGIVAAAVTCVAAVIFMVGQRTKVLLAAATVVTIGVVYLTANPAPLERVTRANEGSGRTELWDVAWKVGADYPIAGVGLNNFTVHSPRYTDEVGVLRYADLIAERPHVVHNTYLEILVETGIVGLLLFMCAVGVGLRATWSAARTFARRGDRELAQLSRGVLLATIAVLTGALFLSLRTRPGLWLLLTLGVVLLAMARSGGPRSRRRRS
jgi:O-antigen ligase